MQVFESNQLWNFDVVDAANPYFQYKFSKRLGKADRPKGAGIYVWVANLKDGTKFVCYTGSYKNNKGLDDVYGQRWSMHIYSKTHRGVFFGFDSERKFSKRHLPIYEKYGFEVKPEWFEARFTKSGSQAAANRTEFSLKYWDELDMTNPFTILWFPSELDGKEIERRETQQLNPVVNAEINKEWDASKSTMSIDETVELVEKVMS